MKTGYEFFDHTADVGLRVFAPSPPELIPAAARGFYAAMGELNAGTDAGAFEFRRSGASAELLLRDFLGDLLLRFERDGHVVRDLTVRRFQDGEIDVRGRLATIDVDRSFFDREVKAVTYHELKIERTSEGCQATVIVDI